MTESRAAGPASGTTASLRTANEVRVLGLLREGGAHTQAQLARHTGLAPATVSSIVRSLTEAGLADTEPGAGRRGSAVRLSTAAGIVAGIDFGHSHVTVALGDLSGQVLGEQRQSLDPAHSHAEGLASAEAQLASLLSRTERAQEEIRSIGLGLPAPVKDSTVRSLAILPGWVGVDAEHEARQRFGVDVHVENDANLGALAEHRFGVARGHSTSVFVKVSSGVGAGIIVNDDLLRGAWGTAGEIGHLTLDDQGPVCRCGSRGCLEAYAAVPAIQGLLAERLPDAQMAEIVAAAADDVAAARALEDAGLALGWGLASVANLLNPALIVVGGDISRAGELFLDAVRTGLRRHALDAVAATPVVASELGERASLVGAVVMAADSTDLLTG